MPIDFAHTLRSLEEKPRLLPWLAVIVCTLAAWAGWLTLTRIRVIVTSERARIESSVAVRRIAAEVDGRLSEVKLQLGQRVQEGEVLAKLDSTAEQTLRDEKRVMLAALALQMNALEEQLHAEREAQSSRRRVDTLGLAQTEVRLEQSRGKAGVEERVTSIVAGLHQEKLATTVEVLRSQSSRDQADFAVQDLSLEAQRLRAASEWDDHRAHARLRALTRELVELRARVALTSAELRTVEARLQKLEVRAPSNGLLGSVASVGPGDVVEHAQELATVVPDAGIRLVAELAPSHEGGRVRPGQQARARLEGYPWTQFGTVEARVVRVANEPRAGTHRVELAVTANSRSIPLRHGLVAEVDIEVDRLAPWQIILAEAIGRTSSHQRAAVDTVAPEP